VQKAGCTNLTAAEVHEDTRDCWCEIRDDRRTHGGDEKRPFFDSFIEDNVGVFILYGTTIDIYVVPGEEQVFQPFKALAMVDVAKARELLAKDLAKPTPDITLSPALSALWLETP
jgi:hypothetical protein